MNQQVGTKTEAMPQTRFAWQPLLWGALLCMLALMVLIPARAQAATDIKLYVNGTEVVPDVKPYMQNDRTFVPVRYATEPLGATLDWEGGSAQTATITKNGVVIKIKIGSKTATIDGVNHTLDAPAAVKNGRTFVPIRFISEGLKSTVDWDNSTKTITITDGGGTITPPAGGTDTPSTNPGGNSSNNNLNKNAFQYIGYYYSKASLEDLKAFQNELTGAIHFGYQLAADGSVNKKSSFAADEFHANGGGYDIAEGAGMDTYMLVTGFSKSVLTTVLSDANLRAKAINQIAATMDERKLDGVDLDFESVDASQRANLVTFVKELRQKLGNDKRITLSAMPRSSSSQYWLDGYDYAGLAKYADYLILMCYNEHYSGGTPGAVASAPWVKKVVDYTINQGVSKNQIIIALGSYGYDWPSGKNGSSLTNTSARSKAEQYGATIYRDQASGCLYYNYTDSSGVAHEVWFEDSVSLGQKAAIAKEYGLGGLAFWRLGFYTTEIWSSILTESGHSNASAWQAKAKDEAAFPVKSGDNSNDGVDIENNGDFVPQS